MEHARDLLVNGPQFVWRDVEDEFAVSGYLLPLRWVAATVIEERLQASEVPLALHPVQRAGRQHRVGILMDVAEVHPEVGEPPWADPARSGAGFLDEAVLGEQVFGGSPMSSPAWVAVSGPSSRSASSSARRTGWVMARMVTGSVSWRGSLAAGPAGRLLG